MPGYIGDYVCGFEVDVTNIDYCFKLACNVPQTYIDTSHHTTISTGIIGGLAASTWMMRGQPQDNDASALTTHQLERRESHRANQEDGDY